MTVRLGSRTYAGQTIWLSLLLPVFFSYKKPDIPAAKPLADSLMVHQESGQFSLITYNIAGLPQIISSAVTDRAGSIAEIGRRLGVYDIAHVQEDFNYNFFLYKQNAHPYRTPTKGKVLFGDGLNMLSRFPIHELKRVKWNDCTGADCLTPKGFTYSRVALAAGVLVDFYNVHANAYNHPTAAAARRNNLLQLSDFIRTVSAGRAVVVMGDLNGRFAFAGDNIRVLTDLGFDDAWVQTRNRTHIPEPTAQMPASDILTIDEQTETIDKILCRSSSELKLLITDYRLEKQVFANAQGVPLSDHHPVSARVSWQITPRPYITKNTQ